MEAHGLTEGQPVFPLMARLEGELRVRWGLENGVGRSQSRGSTWSLVYSCDFCGGGDVPRAAGEVAAPHADRDEPQR